MAGHDCGREWKLESEWLPEDHPMVQAMLKKRLAWLKTEPLREQ